MFEKMQVDGVDYMNIYIDNQILYWLFFSVFVGVI